MASSTNSTASPAPIPGGVALPGTSTPTLPSRSLAAKDSAGGNTVGTFGVKSGLAQMLKGGAKGQRSSNQCVLAHEPRTQV
ncbi:hypothetical protein FRB94_007061 [Tulasnella sp. JGI-2019a]|nr:hypothetical protein FRB94_007061 [Tulasnella sp. JGI-2019a]KAG9016972.1 hypothetical protein FRB93_009502 [Tulasnella sp. JGI-2019a]